METIELNVEVRDDAEGSRYRIYLDGEPVGLADYQLRGGRRYFVHTEIQSGHEGQGLGTILAREALALARASGEPIVPLCPFISAYLRDHPDEGDIVDREMLDRIDGS